MCTWVSIAATASRSIAMNHSVPDVGGVWRGDHLHGFQGGVAGTIEQPLPRAEQHRRDVQVHLVEQPRDEVLADRRGPTRDHHPYVAARRAALPKGGRAPVC